MSTLCYWSPLDGMQHWVGNDGSPVFVFDPINHKLTIGSGATLDASAGTLSPPLSAFIFSASLPYFYTAVTTLTSGTGYSMSAAQVLGGLTMDTTTSTGGFNAQLPLVSAITTAALPAAINVAGGSFDFCYNNLGTNAVTLTTNTGWTNLVGNMTVSATTMAHFRMVYINSSTANLYRL